MATATQAAPLATYARALILGVVTGLRSMAALARLTFAAQPERDRPLLAAAPEPWRRLGTRPALAGIGLATAGEVVGDKLSATPPRTQPGPLAIRLIAGGLAGAIACRAAGRSPLLGAALGAAGAFLGSHAGYQYRTRAARATGAPDLALALLEDCAAHALAAVTVRGM